MSDADHGGAFEATPSPATWADVAPPIEMPAPRSWLRDRRLAATVAWGTPERRTNLVRLVVVIVALTTWLGIAAPGAAVIVASFVISFLLILQLSSLSGWMASGRGSRRVVVQQGGVALVAERYRAWVPTGSIGAWSMVRGVFSVRGPAGSWSRFDGADLGSPPAEAIAALLAAAPRPRPVDHREPVARWRSTKVGSVRRRWMQLRLMPQASALWVAATVAYVVLLAVPLAVLLVGERAIEAGWSAVAARLGPSTVLLALGLALTLAVALVLLSRRNRTEETSTWTLAVGDDGFRIGRTEGDEVDVLWASVRRYQLVLNWIGVATAAPHYALIVPTAAFAPGASERFVALLERAGARPVR